MSAIKPGIGASAQPEFHPVFPIAEGRFARESFSSEASYIKESDCGNFMEISVKCGQAGSCARDTIQVIKPKYELGSIVAMFTIRPIIAALAIGIALLAVLASAHSSNPQAENFAALHHRRCLQQRPAPAPELCALRTIQLASHLYGMEFADQVAQALE